MNITIPELSLLVLIGPSGSGKSSFGAKHFLPTEVVSSDFCRALVSDDENNLAATKDAFDLLHFITSKRLAAGKLTVVDATNVKPEDRKPLIKLARDHHCIPVAIVLKLPDKICYERNASRPERDFGRHVIRQQSQQMRKSLRRLDKEGFRHVHIFSTPEEVESVTIERTPLWNDRRSEHGPFDIIGDVHGCFDELEELLGQLGYEKSAVSSGAGESRIHPDGRKAIFLGDLVDRGPRIIDTLFLVKSMVEAGSGECVPGNHDMKLVRKLRGRDVQITHGLDQTLAEIESLPDDRREADSKAIADFLQSLTSHYVFDDGKLVVAHAGMKEEMQGRGSRKVRDFALYGETTGETDEFGLPVRYNWALEYRGRARVVYGHTPVPEAEWLNNTINIDTGCVFGGKLTALRYPELELVSVPPKKTYCEPIRPLGAEDELPVLTAQQRADEVLEIEDVIGKRIVTTRLQSSVTIREENAIAALEVMSRFAVDPKWLIYLPPTMSPVETSSEEGMLEHPAEAFSFYRQRGIPRVICQEKHMGSRAVVIICRDEEAARRRFGVIEQGMGICYTRTGRRFFDDRDLEQRFLEKVRSSVDAAGLWDELATDWMVLDCELMPWSAKAQELLRQQYAALGAAARLVLPQALEALGHASGSHDEARELSARLQEREAAVSSYVEAYGRYCWPVESINDLKLAPFHLLATEGAVHADKDHSWHMTQLERLCQNDGLLMATEHRFIDVTDPSIVEGGVSWWHEITERGSEGMVVKPADFVARGRKGLVQPAVKCRGVEYLRIIYGPEYTLPGNLERLRERGLGHKRSLALREFALGIEALERFVRGEPLRRVHEAVFGVLALESEPVDPRL